MAITATTPATSQYQGWVVYPDLVREFMRDYPDKNPLVGDVEFTDKEIERAITLVLGLSNIISRVTDYKITTFPNAYVLMLGVAAHLLKTEAMRQLRNEATYQDGNIQPVGIDNKQQGYLQMSGVMQQEFNQMVTTIKLNENMNTFGQMRSPIAQSIHIR